MHGHYYHAHFDGSVGEYFPIFFKNLILTILTLGIYSAWAATNTRRYFASHFEIAGSRYHYHGTGKEIFVGRLKVFAFLLTIFLFCFWAFSNFPEDSFFIFALSLYVLVFVLSPVAFIAMLRYRLSRTSWNQIRMRFTGDWREFLPIYVRGALLSLVSLGLYVPFFTIKAYRYICKNTWLGNQSYAFDGDGIELMEIYLKGILFSILTFGIYYFWFLSHYHNYLISHITVGGSRYLFNSTGLDFLTLILTQLFVFIFTLGLGTPILYVLTAKFVAKHLYLDSTFDPQKVRPLRVDSVDATGEALYSVFEAG